MIYVALSFLTIYCQIIFKGIFREVWIPGGEDWNWSTTQSGGQREGNKVILNKVIINKVIINTEHEQETHLKSKRRCPGENITRFVEVGLSMYMYLKLQKGFISFCFIRKTKCDDW